ncbi:hypothetical protein Cgig2_023524 [Carnegiea gigantea]|uniref:GrpE protein homolog n=1 Tax=Carnegiea gigantea TaxID=171969 RepID=A0A9Q1JI17_9CARY|nr:hypothetical protein Cgig2_023524 [Carnegiea gigantea]
MAVSLSSIPRCFCASFSAKPSKPIIPSRSLIFPTNFPLKTQLVLSTSTPSCLSLSSPLLPHNFHSRRAFRCSVSSQEDVPESMNESEQDGTEDVDEEEDAGSAKAWDSVETLIRFYREAVLQGDQQSIAEIETAFYRLETDKNELAEKVSALSGEINSAKERFIRLQADFDNFRKRSEKERLSIRSDAQGEVIESLLPMVDNFERAKQQLKPETEKEKQIDTSYQGIYKQFVEIMKSLQVAAVDTVGKPFDPNLHEAIAREESDEFDEGIVSQEFRRGFRLGERLLRPAMVKVSSGPGKSKSAETTEASTEQSAESVSSEEQPAAAAAVDER